MLVHHLRVGRSVFTVWLLEELGLPYELKIYDRGPTFRAPPELKAAHPLGKSPVIEVDGVTLAESGAIAAYLLERHDPAHSLAPAPDAPAAERAAFWQWLHYPEGSGFLPLLLKMLLMREGEPKPAQIAAFAEGEVALHLGYLRDQLGDRPFILGERFQGPDVGLVYLLSLAQRLGELGPYPTLAAYLERATARPAFQRAMAKTGG